MAEDPDPQGPRWGGLEWSGWHLLDDTAAPRRVSREAGIYRLRCEGQPELLYAGISDKLSKRLGGLRRARGNPPSYKGHSAARCVAAIESQGEAVEVSWALTGDLDRRELLGREVDLIAAWRARYGQSPVSVPRPTPGVTEGDPPSSASSEPLPSRRF